MTPERWQEVKKVLAGALERTPEERSAYLDQACTEPALRREVESLIDAHEQGDTSFMQQPALDSSHLQIGAKLGPYTIAGRIGAGGMGEVYRAHDTKLKRDVAIKVLPLAFVRDPDRLSRFEREARMLASLNHANIAAIYGLEESGSTRALVMELAEGPTLADRIRQGPIPIEETLAIAKQMAEALEYAHERGIIHRDLKPANVKVSADDTVKILDFGLAKAMETEMSAAEMANSPTLSHLATQAGVLLGTAAYMSPEQAKAKPVDRRADIWAFGCVLYEMLTGKMPFRGESVTDTLAAVIKEEPDWSQLPAATPTHVRVLLRRCLQKDVRQRLQAMGDARIALDEVLSGAPEPSSVAATSVSAPFWRRPLILGVGALLLVAIASLATWNLKPRSTPPEQPVTRTVMNLPPGQQLAGLENGSAVALSPDGTHLAYVAIQGGTQQVYLRAMDSLEARPIPGTEGAVNPFFSPDGQWVGFFAGGKLKKVSASGGAALTLSDAAQPRGASWSNQGMIAFAPTTSGALHQVSEAGGAPQPLTHIEKGEIAHRWPEFLPGGKAVLFAAAPGTRIWTYAQVAVQSVATGERGNMIQAGTQPHYAPSGHLLYAQKGNLMAVPFDPQRLTASGAAVPVVEGVLQSPVSGAAQYGFSSTGSLVYVPGGLQSAQGKLVWVNRNGAEQPVAAPARAYLFPRLSPDGRRVAVEIAEQESQVWLYDLARDALTRLTFEGKSNTNPSWTPDGKRIAFQSSREGPLNIFWQRADGSGGLERLTSSESLQGPNSWSPDGQLLAFIEVNPKTGYDIWVLRSGDPSASSGQAPSASSGQAPSAGSGQAREAQPFLRTPFTESAPRFSPDGRWLAYVSDASGRYEVYVQPYPGPGGKWQISTEGGTEPAWHPNGREMFYRSGYKMMAVGIATQPSFAADKPRVLFEGPYLLTPGTFPLYDVSPDGQRFLMVKPSEQAGAATTQINVVLNWFEELKRLVPMGTK